MKKKIIIICSSIVLLCAIIVGFYFISTKTMRGIYHELIKSDSSFSNYRKMYDAIDFKTSFFNNKITIKDNNYIHHITKEKDYIVYKNIPEASLFEYFEFIVEAVANYYKMDVDSVKLYVENLYRQDKSSKYFIMEEDDKSITYKYYLKKYIIPTVDDYIKEGDLFADIDPDEELTKDNYLDDGFTHITGKIYLFAKRGKDKTITIDIGEYEENTDLTYKSIINSVKEISPHHMDEFLKEFTEIKEIKDSNKGYTVTYLKDNNYDINNYKFIRLTFKD